MNYCVQIESGTGPGITVPFIEDVYRFGRDRKCEIQVSTKAAHALTIFRRAESVFVLNRTKFPVQLGKVALDGGATAKWLPNTGLVIDGIRLKLQPGSKRPSDAHAGTAVRESASFSSLTKSLTSAQPAAASSAGQTKSQVSQILVIVACLIMIGLTLWLGSGLESSSDAQHQQLAALSDALRETAIAANTGQESLRRAERLLDILAQYRISVAMKEKPSANVTKTEARNFCESLTGASGLSDEERKIVRQLSVVLGQIP